MPSPRWPSAPTDSPGPRRADGGKYGSGRGSRRPTRPCAGCGKRIPTGPMPSPSARMAACWPAGAGTTRSSCGTSKVPRCSGRAGIPRASKAWLLLPMAACWPPGAMMPPSGSGTSSVAPRWNPVGSASLPRSAPDGPCAAGGPTNSGG
jgi:hypothetical protein